jgi:hypothetical protein
VFNVPESTKAGSDYITEDKKQIVDIINSSDIQVAHSIVRIQRLGQRQDNRVRPIKITFENSVDAKNLIYEKNKFPPNIKLKRDYTIMQRNHLRELWSQVEARKTKGDDNISVKFFNGTPKIVANRKNY